MIGYVIRAALATVLLLLAASCGGAQGGAPEGAQSDTRRGDAAGETSAADGGVDREGPLTYVALGDSLSVGVGASDPRETGYAPLYRDHLEEETGREVRLVQLGVSGETTGTMINAPEAQLDRARAALSENPGAAVTLSIGANDLLREADGTDAEREAALARYAANLDYILRTLNAASDPPPDITVLAIYNPAPGSFTDEWAGRLNAEVRAVAERNGARVAAADQAFRGNEAEYSHYDQYSYDIHPTDAGYEALARAFAEAEKS